MDSLVDLALKTSGCELRYQFRKSHYQALAVCGNLPQNMDGARNDKLPWCCHGLAFRMATYSNASEGLFARWNDLLSRTQTAQDWTNEYANWSSDNNHWAEKWDRFYHFIWLLQCYEYFTQLGYKISFPAASAGRKPAPDMELKLGPTKSLFVECYFYSKWWLREAYLEDMLHLIDANLSVKRVHNIGPTVNPFSDDAFKKTLVTAAGAVIPCKLKKAAAAASDRSPQTICRLGESDVSIILNGNGEYEPDPSNAHGSPSSSLQNFVREISKAKECKNSLKELRPNILMVNGLGIDFQLSNLTNSSAAGDLESGNIDELWIACCGIGDKLVSCPGLRRLQRSGYEGSGL